MKFGNISRDDVATIIHKKTSEKLIIDTDYDMLESIVNMKNRKGYNPDLITEDNVKHLKVLGLVSGGFKSIKITEKGYSYIYEAGKRIAFENNAIYDKADELVDIAITAFDNNEDIPKEVLRFFED